VEKIDYGRWFEQRSIGRAIALAGCQIVMFIVLHDFAMNLAAKTGQSDYVRGGVSWGMTLHYSMYIFVAICIICSFLSVLFFPRQRVIISLIGFAIFAYPFIDDVFHLTSWTHPKRALLWILAGFFTLPFPYLMFEAVSRIRILGGRKWA
jgi:hypothetical protein